MLLDWKHRIKDIAEAFREVGRQLTIALKEATLKAKAEPLNFNNMQPLADLVGTAIGWSILNAAWAVVEDANKHMHNRERYPRAYALRVLPKACYNRRQKVRWGHKRCGRLPLKALGWRACRLI